MKSIKTAITVWIVLFAFTATIFGQGFEVKAKGKQTFNFKDQAGRNQATFYSSAPLEDINGLTSDINGTVTFDVSDVAKTLQGEIFISSASIKTGIDLRDEHLRGEGWLHSEKFPQIKYQLKEVKNLSKTEPNKLTGKVDGLLTIRGITKEVTSDITLTYLDESETTKKRAPGDLLGVNANFTINLSDFGIKNDIIGEKVAEKIEIKVNMVGSNSQG